MNYEPIHEIPLFLILITLTLQSSKNTHLIKISKFILYWGSDSTPFLAFIFSYDFLQRNTMNTEYQWLKEHYKDCAYEKYFTLSWEDVESRYLEKGYKLADRMITRAVMKAFKKVDEEMGIA